MAGRKVAVCDNGTGELIDVEGDGMADMAFLCIQGMDTDNRMMIYQYNVL